MGIEVVKAGLLTTVQDLGRWGFQRFGVPVSGAMDGMSHRLANLLVGNLGSAATLEVTLDGPDVTFDAATAFAVTGAEFELRLDGSRVRMNRSHVATSGQTLTFGPRRAGARAYLALAGGVDVPVVLGSRSTYVPSAIGGVSGRALRPGDRIPVGTPTQSMPASGRHRPAVTTLPRDGARVRVIADPDTETFDATQLNDFCAARFEVATESNRMGYRLGGGRVLTSGTGGRISTAVSTGSIQVPPSGAPIVLLADHQTVGGYPAIATVISADLPVVAQLKAPDWIEFEPCTREAALRALRGLERSVMT